MRPSAALQHFGVQRKDSPSPLDLGCPTAKAHQLECDRLFGFLVVGRVKSLRALAGAIVRFPSIYDQDSESELHFKTNLVPDRHVYELSLDERRR